MTSPDPNAQSGTVVVQGDDTAGQGTGNGTATGVSDGQSAGSEQEQKQQSTQDVVTRAEYDQLRNQLRAADQKRAEAEQALKQLRDKDLPEMERIKRDLQEASEERDKLREELQAVRLENAFLSSNTIKWKNPRAALKLADLSNVTIDDSGKVIGLEAALQALAKSDPYLVDTSDGDVSGNNGKGSTGAPAGSRPQETKADLKKMATRFPALRSRGLGQ